jgi:6-phosphogluconolactonase (cycloisomerase 2 family)
MPEASRNLKNPPKPAEWVEYADPSGGLNTKRDVHALDRNMLAVSINGWPAYDNVIAKRPASSFYVNTSTGATGLAGALLRTISGSMNNPKGIAFDASGNLYVVNSGANNVTVYNAGGSLINTISASMSSPQYVAFNSGNLYVANYSGNNVTVYNAGGSLINTISGSMSGPVGVKFNSGNLYVANYGGNNVTVYNAGGSLINTISGSMNNPQGIAFDASSNLYVANSGAPNNVTVYNNPSGSGTTIVATRWTISGASTTVLLAQNGTALAFAAVGAGAWTNISTAMGAGAKRIHVAQMFDPLTGAIQCFICNGVDQPWMWQGPGFTTLTQTSVANGLPVNAAGSVGITPRFVTTVGNNSVLVYSGEPTSTTAVYISNAFYPQAFTQSSTTATPYPGSYQPYLIGFNDGVNGGAVTGITSLQGNILCFKESAIYRGQFVNIYSATYGFQWQTVSASRGMVAPESLASFDTYDVFLSNDGVYYTDGYQVQQISANVPTFFDGSLNGYGPLCLAYTTAVGVRCGSRYIIWYDRGLPNAPGVPAGYPTSGVWFDFAKPDIALLPQAGEMQGALSQYPFTAPMPVAGAAQLNGPNDQGLFVWTSATADQVALFGMGFVEFGGAITTTFAGPADRFTQVASDSSFFDRKSIKSARFAIAANAPGGNLLFTATFTTDFLLSTSASATTPTAPGSGGAVFGTGIFGTSAFGSGTNGTVYEPVTITPSAQAYGRMIQTMLSETSTTEWLLLGYMLEITRTLPTV